MPSYFKNFLFCACFITATTSCDLDTSKTEKTKAINSSKSATPTLGTKQDLFNSEVFIPVRIKNFIELAKALENYKKDHNQYPISPNNGKNWGNIVTETAQENTEWIPGLVPQYISKLPRDPRNNSQQYHQYIYKSNGANYKLIALNPDDCNYVKMHAIEFIDAEFKGCHYGIWTPNASKWK